MDKKVVFLGTDNTAAEFLQTLYDSGFNIKAVITQTDKPFGRKAIITPLPVKSLAQQLKIDVYQPKSSKDIEALINQIKPDFGIVVAYGRILPKKILDMIPYGFFNVHFSLLPKYRGADPVRAAVLNGETKSGVTIFKIDEGLDTGPVLFSESIEIGSDETSYMLLKRLSALGRRMIIEATKKISSGDIKLLPQEGVATYTTKVTIKDTYIDFNIPAEKVYSKIKAFSFDPYSRFIFKHNGKNTVVQITSAKINKSDTSNFAPACISGFEKGTGIFVKCLDTSVLIEKVKPEGKKEMNAYDFFINGLKLKKGDSLI